MPDLGTFTTGEKVFLLESAAAPESPDHWIGVEIVEHDDVNSMILVKIVFTNDIPGYALDETLWVADHLGCVRELTIDKLIELRDAGCPAGEVPTAGADDHADPAGDEDEDEDPDDD